MNCSPVNGNTDTEIRNNLSISDVYNPDDFSPSLQIFPGLKEDPDNKDLNTTEHSMENADSVNVSSSWFFELTHENEIYKQKIKDLEQEKEKQEKETAETEVKLSELLDQLVNTEMKLEKETEKCKTLEKEKSLLEIKNEQLITEMYLHGHKKPWTRNDRVTGLNRKLLQKTQLVEKLNRKLFACRNQIAIKNKLVRNMKSHIKEVWEILTEIVQILAESGQLEPDKKDAILKKCEEFLTFEILPTESGAAVYNNLSSCSTILTTAIANELPENVAENNNIDFQDIESSPSLFISPENEVSAIGSPSSTPSLSVDAVQNLDKHQSVQKNTPFTDQSEASFANIQMTFSIAPFLDENEESNSKEGNTHELSSNDIKFTKGPILPVRESSLNKRNNQPKLNSSLPKLEVDTVLPVGEISSAAPIVEGLKTEKSPLEITDVDVAIEHPSPKIIEDSVHSVNGALMRDLYLSEDSLDTVSASEQSDNTLDYAKDTITGDLYLSEDSLDATSSSSHNDALVKINTHSVAKNISKHEDVSKMDIDADVAKDNELQVNSNYDVAKKSAQYKIVTESELTQGNVYLPSTYTVKNNLTSKSFEKKSTKDIQKLVSSPEKNTRLKKDNTNMSKKSKPQLTYDALLYSLLEGDFKQNPAIAASVSKNEDNLANNVCTATNLRNADNLANIACADLALKNGMASTLKSKDYLENNASMATTSKNEDNLASTPKDGDILANNTCLGTTLPGPVVTFPSDTNDSTSSSSKQQKRLDSNLEVEAELSAHNKVSIIDMFSPINHRSSHSNRISTIPNKVVSENDSNCDHNSLHKEIYGVSNENHIANESEKSIDRHGLNDTINQSSDSTIIYGRSEIIVKDASENHNNAEPDNLVNESPNKFCTIVAKKFEDGSVRLGFNLVKSCTVTLDTKNGNVSCTFQEPENSLQILNNDNFSPTLNSNDPLNIENKKNMVLNEKESISNNYGDNSSLSLHVSQESSAGFERFSACNKDVADKVPISEKNSEIQSATPSIHSLRKSSRDNDSDLIEKMSDNNSVHSDGSLDNNCPSSSSEKNSHENKSNKKKGSKKKTKKKSKEKKDKKKSKEKKTKIKSKDKKSKKKSKNNTKKKSKNEKRKEKTSSKKRKNSKIKRTSNSMDEISSEIVEEALKAVKDCRLQIFNECTDIDTDEESLRNIVPITLPNEEVESSFQSHSYKNDLDKKSDSNNCSPTNKNTIGDSQKQVSFSFTGQTSKDKLNSEMDGLNHGKRLLMDPCAIDNPYSLFGIALLDKNSQISNDNGNTNVLQSELNELDLLLLDTNTMKTGTFPETNKNVSNLECSLSQQSEKSTNHVSPTPKSNDSVKLSLFNGLHKCSDTKHISSEESHISILDQIRRDFGLIEDDCLQEDKSSYDDKANLHNDTDKPSEDFENTSQSTAKAILVKNTSDILCEDNSCSSDSDLPSGQFESNVPSTSAILAKNTSDIVSDDNSTDTSDSDSHSKDFENVDTKSSAVLVENTSDVVGKDDSSHSSGFLTNDSIFEISSSSVSSETSVQPDDSDDELEMNEQNKNIPKEPEKNSSQIEKDSHPITEANDESMKQLPGHDLSIKQVPYDKKLSEKQLQTNNIDIDSATQSTYFSAEDKVHCDTKEPESFEELLLKHMKEKNIQANLPKPTGVRELLEKNPEVSCNDILDVYLKDIQSTEEDENSSNINEQEKSEAKNPYLGMGITDIFDDILNSHLEHVKILEENQNNTNIGIQGENIADEGRELALKNDKFLISSNAKEISNNKVVDSNLFDPSKEEPTVEIDIKVLPSDNVLSQFSSISTDSMEQNKKLQESSNIESKVNKSQHQDQESFCQNDASIELYDPVEIVDNLNKKENYENVVQPCSVVLESIEVSEQCLNSDKNIKLHHEKDIDHLSSDLMYKVKESPESCSEKSISSVDSEEEKIGLTKNALPLRTSPRKNATTAKYNSNLVHSKPTTSVVSKKTPSKDCKNRNKVAKVKKINIKECRVVLERINASPLKHSSPSVSKRKKNRLIQSKLLDFVNKDKMNELQEEYEDPDISTNARENNNSLNTNSSCTSTKETTNVFFLNQTSTYEVKTEISNIVNGEILLNSSEAKSDVETDESNSMNAEILPGSSEAKPVSITSELTPNEIKNEEHKEIPKKGKRKRGKSESSANKRLRSEPKTVKDYFEKYHITHRNVKTFEKRVCILKEMLSNPENYPNMTVLLYDIVKYLSLSERNPLLMFMKRKDKSVLLPTDEDCIVTAFFEIESEKTPHLKGLLKGTVNIIQNLLISKKTLTIYGSASLCRVATEICKRQEDKSAVLVLCCDLLKRKHEFGPYLIASIVSIWMELFKENAGLSDEEIIFLSSIAYAAKVRTNLTDTDWNTSNKILSTYLNSRRVNNVQKTINVMMDTIQVSCCDESWVHCHMLTSAVTLFAVHEDYIWIELNIIKRFVAPLLQKFGSEMVHKKAFELFCNLYVDLFLMNPRTNPKEEVLIKFFQKENIREDSSYIQENAALALMKYLFLKNIPLPKLLTRWFEKNHSNPKVKAIRKLFTRKPRSTDNKRLQEEDFELNVI